MQDKTELWVKGFTQRPSHSSLALLGSELPTLSPKALTTEPL